MVSTNLEVRPLHRHLALHPEKTKAFKVMADLHGAILPHCTTDTYYMVVEYSRRSDHECLRLTVRLRQHVITDATLSTNPEDKHNHFLT
ncbi:hypothetical protein J6590_106209 [Homalodisca vitripennis]|nr:hypothetical protein J6590_106209 [Homalodisca vitripennis]